jgi:hypothetical protein
MSFRRTAALALAAAALSSGCKKVTQEAPTQELVIAAFNSQTCSDPSLAAPLRCQTGLPTPNDLALYAAPLLPDGGQKALLKAFIAAGGFPGDQAVGITIPIKRLIFNAATGNYDLADYAHSPLVNQATLTTTGASRTVVVLKIDAGSPIEQTVEVDPANCTTGQIALIKVADPTRGGSRVWAPGRYVFAISTGVRTTTGLAVSADQAISLSFPNKDLTNPNNQPPGGLPPALAAQVDQVRRTLWNPVDWNNVSGTWQPNGPGTIAAFTAVASFIPPEQVAAIGTFEIATGAQPVPGAPLPTAPVDSGSGLAPLPIDLLRTANSGTTIAPNPAFGAASQGLATLDGFSTTAMILAPVTMPVDASTVNGGTVRVFKLKNGAVTPLKEFKREFGLACATNGALGDPAHADYIAQPPPIITPQGVELVPGQSSSACAPAGGCSVVIGLQPAAGIPIPTACPGGAAVPPAVQALFNNAGVFLPPLDEATDYAVVITTAVNDALPSIAGGPRRLQKATVAKILVDPGFDPIATSSVNGKSLLAGISDETATALQKMRLQLGPVLTAAGLTPNDVVLAYTFRTQGSIAATALRLVDVPYGFGSGKVVDATFLSTAQVAGAYLGGDPTYLVSPAGLTGIAEVRLTTSSLLLQSQNAGAFVDPVKHPELVAPETITALVALPDPANVPSTCAHVAGFGYPAALRCAPLVIYSHGLTDTKADMLPIAAALTARGFIVAAVDAEKHGERSYCVGKTQAEADQQCCPTAKLDGPLSTSICGTATCLSNALCGGATCAVQTNLTTPVDVTSTGAPLLIGFCQNGGGSRQYFSYRADYRTTPGCESPFLPDHTPNPAYPPACLSPKGNAFTSGQQLVSLNFFRVRDSMRQDVVDKSALGKALGPIPFDPNSFAMTLAGQGLAVDPTRTYYVAHSYGAITGAMTLAVNPRVSRGVLAAPGATAIDVFSNPDSHYSAVLNALLSSAGISPGTSDYLKTLQLGKWILDPADPANFVSYVTPGALPTPFDPAVSGTTTTAPLAALFPQPQRDILSEFSFKDGSVPNAQNAYYAGRLGYLIPPVSPAATDSFVQWYFDPVPPGTVSHENLIDFKNASLTQQAQSNAAEFLVNPAGQTGTVIP